MSATILNFQVARVMAATKDAYRRQAYGEVQWALCADYLLNLGCNVETSAGLMESRIMRWAQEDADDYDAPTVDDLRRFLNTSAGASALRYELAA